MLVNQPPTTHQDVLECDYYSMIVDHAYHPPTTTHMCIRFYSLMAWANSKYASGLEKKIYIEILCL